MIIFLKVQRQAVSTNQELLTIYKDVLPLHASVSAVTTAQNNIASKYRSMLHQVGIFQRKTFLRQGLRKHGAWPRGLVHAAKNFLAPIWMIENML